MKEIRNCILKFRTTEEEKSIIMKKVDASDLSISEYLRRCALGKQIVVVNGLDDLARELRAIGNNLNQITRAVNSGYHIVESQRTENVTVIFIFHQDQILLVSRIGRDRNKIRDIIDLQNGAEDKFISTPIMNIRNAGEAARLGLTLFQIFD